MIQKVIKIGSSYGVTIPRSRLRELNIVPGDEIDVEIRGIKTNKIAKHKKLLSDLEDFMNIYDQDLKNLANR